MRTIQVTSDPGPDWATFQIPGSEGPVRMRRLHVDPATRSSVSVVSFPPGWQRDERGYYSCAEEFLVLEGELSVSGRQYSAGDYAYLPPRDVRAASTTTDGCLVVAYFSGIPEWGIGEPAEPADREAVHLATPGIGWLRTPGSGIAGDAELLAGLDGQTYAVDVDLLCPAQRSWAHLPAGERAPRLDAPVLLRRWS